MSETALPEPLIEAAITWAIRLDYNTATASTRSDFERWLQEDPQHALAWQRVGSLRGSFALPGLAPRLARQALDSTQQRNQSKRLGRRAALRLLSVGALAMGTGWMAREHTPWQRLVAQASTRVGEQRSLTLSDGSQIRLNTDSAVSADLDGPQRWVTLHRGEIQINTGSDHMAMAEWGGNRPFWVHTPFGEMRALGTRFTVRLHADRARISVQEGAVQLHPTQGGRSPIVRPGQSYWLRPTDAVRADTHGMEPDAWTDGVIAGKDMRLADLLAEIERYRHGRILCDDKVADLQVSGLFHVRDTDQALQFLVQTQPISVTMTTRLWVRVTPEE